MCKRYGKFRLVSFPRRFFEMDFNDLMNREQTIKNEYGFTKGELRHIIKHKPTLLMYKDEY